MKNKIALFFLLLVASLKAAAPSPQVGFHFYYNGSAFLGGSSYDCSNNGGVTFVLLSNGYRYAYFDDNAAKYMGGSSALSTWINANKSNMQIQITFIKNNNALVDGLWFWSFDSGLCNGDVTFYSSGNLPIIQDGQAPACLGGGNTGALNTTEHTAIFSVTGGFDYFYLDGTLLSTVAVSTEGTLDVAAEFGRYTNSFPGDEYIRDVVFSNGSVCNGGPCPAYVVPSGAQKDLRRENSVLLAPGTQFRPGP